MIHSIVAIFLLSTLGFSAQGQDFFYTSGKLRLKTTSPKGLTRRDQSVSHFLKHHFKAMNAPLKWRLVRTIKDNTHRHYRYQLQHAGIPVFGHNLDLHVDNFGRVDFATSTWQRDFTVPSTRGALSESVIRRRVLKLVGRAGQRAFKGRIDLTPMIYVPKEGPAHYAYEAHAFLKKPTLHRHLFVDAHTGEKLDELNTLRFISHDIYEVHPDSAVKTSKTLPDVTTLLSDGSILHVRRERGVSPHARVDIDASSDFTNDGFDFDSATHDDNDYATTCNSALDTGCPNQSFDGVNVYYHIKDFRTNLDAYFSDLGVSASFSLDPIDVTVNMRSYDVNQDTVLNDFNNAFYGLNLLDANGVVRSGLFFLPPADTSGSSSVCPSSAFYDLAREALVIVHEYQHYITDRVTGMIAGGSLYNLGDTLHEGYSDYFGASQVTRSSGVTTTEIGAFAFKSCADLRRDIAVQKVFSNTSSSSIPDNFMDAHTAGWTWASGLWTLRTQLGREAADKLAFKSLFFLSTRPGFVEAVEALVAADNALNNGANAATIRTLFYSTLNFVGSFDTSKLLDVNNFIIDAGFQSCLSVPMRAASGPASSGIFGLWFVMTLWLGRRKWRQ